MRVSYFWGTKLKWTLSLYYKVEYLKVHSIQCEYTQQCSHSSDLINHIVQFLHLLKCIPPLHYINLNSATYHFMVVMNQIHLKYHSVMTAWTFPVLLRFTDLKEPPEATVNSSTKYWGQYWMVSSFHFPENVKMFYSRQIKPFVYETGHYWPIKTKIKSHFSFDRRLLISQCGNSNKAHILLWMTMGNPLSSK